MWSEFTVHDASATHASSRTENIYWQRGMHATRLGIFEYEYGGMGFNLLHRLPAIVSLLVD